MIDVSYIYKSVYKSNVFGGGGFADWFRQNE